VQDAVDDEYDDFFEGLKQEMTGSNAVVEQVGNTNASE